VKPRQFREHYRSKWTTGSYSGRVYDVDLRAKILRLFWWRLHLPMGTAVSDSGYNRQFSVSCL
jgi:hypothetical protein